MNIDTELFRVLDDAELDLKDTPTVIKPFYRSKKDYRNILDEDTIELRDQQRCLECFRTILASYHFSGYGCCRQRWRDQTRHVRCQSARMSRSQFQGANRSGTQTRFFMAVCPAIA